MNETCDAKWLRRELLGCIDPGRRDAMFAVDQRRTWWSFAHIWAALLLSFLVIYAVRNSAWPARLGIGLLAILFIGTRQNALGVRVHEGSHFLLFRNRRLNDSLCNWLAAYWVGTDIRAYRSVHWRHHRFLHTADDPDRDVYLLPEKGGVRSVLPIFLADLAGLTAFKRLRLLLAGGREPPASGGELRRSHLLGIGAGQLALMALAVYAFGALEGAVHYAVFWLLPLATVYPFIIRLRTVAEHYSEELHQAETRPFISRTSLTGWLERYLVGADMEYHLEHHLNPAIPHYRLRQLNQCLKKRGIFERLGEEKSKVLNDGYVRFWMRLAPQHKPSWEAKGENAAVQRGTARL